MLVDVTGHLSSPLLLVLNEIIVKIIKERKLLVESHKLIIAQIALYVPVVCLIQERLLLISLYSPATPQLRNALSVGFLKIKPP